MVASVLSTVRAIEVSVFVVRAFVKLRETLASHNAVTRKLSILERKVSSHDTEIRALFAAIRKLMLSPPRAVRKIGFDSSEP
jgi:hypothetical protein